MNISDCRVLVTGASRGIGEAIAKGFSRSGAKTVVLAARNADALARVKAEIEEEGGHAAFHAIDLSTRESCRELARIAGEIDILINNAAITSGANQNVLTRNDEFWDLNMAVGFTAPLTLLQEIGRGMKERGHGVVINISSISAQRLTPNFGPYGIAKNALDSLSRVAGMELARCGIRVNSVSLGYVDTEALAQACGEGVTPDALAAMGSPLGRAIRPAEVAELCIFLASDAAAAIMGTVITMDGGVTAGSFSLGEHFE